MTDLEQIRQRHLLKETLRQHEINIAKVREAIHAAKKFHNIVPGCIDFKILYAAFGEETLRIEELKKEIEELENV